MVVKRGQIWLTKFDPTIAHFGVHQSPLMHCAEAELLHSKNGPTVIVVPLTSQITKKRLPTHVLIPQATTGLKADSVALTEHVRL